MSPFIPEYLVMRLPLSFISLVVVVYANCFIGRLDGQTTGPIQVELFENMGEKKDVALDKSGEAAVPESPFPAEASFSGTIPIPMVCTRESVRLLPVRLRIGYMG